MEKTGLELLRHYEEQRTRGKKAPEIAKGLGVGLKGLEKELTRARKMRDELAAAATIRAHTNPVAEVALDCVEGKEYRLLFLSDVHFDSVFCHRDLLAEHLEKALVTKALVFSFGDLFDAMQGRFDPRRSAEELRPEYRRSDYYDFVVDDLGDYLLPYLMSLRLLANGNHEASVLKNCNINLIDRLVKRLNQDGAAVQAGGYGGWIRLVLKTSQARRVIRIKYFHGSGGEAPVTRGAIQTNRQAVYLPDADVVVNGHSHNAYYIPIGRERVSASGEQYFDLQHHVRIPGYKMSYADGTGGWEVERGGVPKPVGCVWMVVAMRSGRAEIRFELDIRGGLAMPPIEAGDGAAYSGKFAQDTEGP